MIADFMLPSFVKEDPLGPKGLGVVGCQLESQQAEVRNKICVQAMQKLHYYDKEHFLKMLISCN
jgi:hypothetical protein